MANNSSVLVARKAHMTAERDGVYVSVALATGSEPLVWVRPGSIDGERGITIPQLQRALATAKRMVAICEDELSR